jgi:hypothetical protein
MDTVYTAAATRHALPHAAMPMSIAKRITLAAICTVGITAALGVAVEHIGSAPAAAGDAIFAAPASSAPGTIEGLAAPTSAPGVTAVSRCASQPAQPGKPGQLPQVVHASNTCRQGTTTGSVSGPPGHGSVCVGYEIECHQPFYRGSI